MPPANIDPLSGGVPTHANPLANGQPIANPNDPLGLPTAGGFGMQGQPMQQPMAAQPMQGGWQQQQTTTNKSKQEASPTAGRIASAAGTLAFLGLGMSILPLVGLQIKFQEALGSAEPFVAFTLTLASAICFFIGMKHNLGLALGVSGTTLAAGIAFLCVSLFSGGGGTDSSGDGGSDAPSMAMPGNGGGGMPGMGGGMPGMGGGMPGMGGDVTDPGEGAANNSGSATQGNDAVFDTSTPINETQTDKFDNERVRFPTAARGKITNVYGGPGGGPFAFIKGEDFPITGIKYTTGEWANHTMLKTVEPLSANTAPTAGAGSEQARAGYVVGGAEVNYGKYVFAIRLIYMKADASGKPDPSDQYTGEWLGNKLDQATTVKIAGDGTRVIGVCGRKGLTLDAFGLIVLEE